MFEGADRSFDKFGEDHAQCGIDSNEGGRGENITVCTEGDSRIKFLDYPNNQIHFKEDI